MEWLTIGSWIFVAFILVLLHSGTTTEGPVWGVLLSAILGALIGGYLVRVLRIPPLSVRGFSVATLIGAIICAEIGILMVVSARGGRHRPHTP